jgi:hypothetical protein
MYILSKYALGVFTCVAALKSVYSTRIHSYKRSHIAYVTLGIIGY